MGWQLSWKYPTSMLESQSPLPPGLHKPLLLVVRMEAATPEVGWGGCCLGSTPTSMLESQSPLPPGLHKPLLLVVRMEAATPEVGWGDCCLGSPQRPCWRANLPFHQGSQAFIVGGKDGGSNS